MAFLHRFEQTRLHPSTAHRILNDLTIGRYVDVTASVSSVRRPTTGWCSVFEP